MKFEFSADVKGLPAAQVKCSFECTAEELSIMLSDPVYQQLGKKLVNEVSFKPQQPQNCPDRRNQHNHRQQPDIEHMRRVYEADRKCQKAHDAAVDTAIKGLQNLIDRIISSKH